jgi:endonuclease YncB( thermonuclease family)
VPDNVAVSGSKTAGHQRQFFATLLALLAVTALTVATERTFSATVIGISDGDTITVLRDQIPVTIRLEGIDCPENGQAYGRRAKQFTSDALFSRTVTVLPKERDRYGRLVARVLIGDMDISLALVRAGYAWHFRQYSTDENLATAEREARSARRGLWQDSNAVAPWEFRRPLTLLSGKSEGPYHGNVRSHALHAVGCPFYDCKNCTVTFATLDAATAAGYHPHTACIR